MIVMGSIFLAQTGLSKKRGNTNHRKNPSMITITLYSIYSIAIAKLKDLRKNINFSNI